MAVLTIPRRRSVQPGRILRIDWSNPLTRGLQFAWTGWGQDDAARGFPVSGANRSPLSVGARGIGAQNTTTGSRLTHRAGNNLPKSIVAVTNMLNFNGTTNFILIHGSPNGWGLSVDNAGLKWTHFGVADYAGISASDWAIETPIVIGVTAIPGASVTPYKRGVAGSPTAIGALNATANTTIDVGRSSPGVTAANTSFAAYWDRALSADEHRSMADDPLQIYRPRKLRLYFSTGSGGTLNASASGAATASGTAAISADVGLAAIGVSVASGSAALAASIPVTAAGLAVAGGGANAVATVSIAAAGLAQAAGQAGLSASVLLQAAGAAQASGNAALAAQLNALASGSAQAGGSATLSGGAPGALSASGGASADGQAVLTVSVQLAATGGAQAGGSATGSASAPGSISASGSANASGFATWSALVSLTASGFVQAMGSGSFTVQVPLAAVGIATAGGSAAASMTGAAGGAWLHASAPVRATRAIAGAGRITRLVHGVHRV